MTKDPRTNASQEQFRERVGEFWFEAFHAPYLSRKELFVVKQRDWTMKALLLEMIEWHAIARNSEPIEEVVRAVVSIGEDRPSLRSSEDIKPPMIPAPDITLFGNDIVPNYQRI